MEKLRKEVKELKENYKTLQELLIKIEKELAKKDSWKARIVDIMVIVATTVLLILRKVFDW